MRLRRRDHCGQHLPHAVRAETLHRRQHQLRVLRGHQAAGTRHRAAVLVIGARRPELYGNILSSPTRGWMLVGCWMAKTDFYARAAATILHNTAYGYGCVLTGACYGCSIKGIYEECRHGARTNTYPDVSDAYAGAPLECTFHDSLAVRCSATAYDNHAGALRTKYINNRVRGHGGQCHGLVGWPLLRRRIAAWRRRLTGCGRMGFPAGFTSCPAAPPAGSSFVRLATQLCEQVSQRSCLALARPRKTRSPPAFRLSPPPAGSLRSG